MLAFLRHIFLLLERALLCVILKVQGGDPLSPMLFVLVVEGLTKLILKAQEIGPWKSSRQTIIVRWHRSYNIPITPLSCVMQTMRLF